MRHTVYIALGSNLGDRLRYLQSAAAALNEHIQCEVVAYSSIYESPAHTLTPDETAPAFLNAVVEMRTSLTPMKLLALCQRIETEHGRTRTQKWAARTLDLDLLWYDGHILNLPNLVLPHPQMTKRRFVLMPLFDLAPSLPIPVPYSQEKKQVAELLAACPDVTFPLITDFSLDG